MVTDLLVLRVCCCILFYGRTRNFAYTEKLKLWLKNLMVGGSHLEEPQYEPDDKIKITVNDTRCTNLKWNEYARNVQWPRLHGTCLYFDYASIERVVFHDEHNDYQLVKMTGLYGDGSGIG